MYEGQEVELYLDVNAIPQLWGYAHSVMDACVYWFLYNECLNAIFCSSIN
jgi:hypothetical protein